MMTSRDRILAALNHREADRVPIDVGGTDCSTIMAGPYRALCAELGIDADPVTMVDIAGQVVELAPRIQDALNSDVKLAYHQPREWRTGTCYDGGPVTLPATFLPQVKEDGTQVVPDSMGNEFLVLPPGGYFFDVRSHPLAGAQTVADLDKAAGEIDNMDRPGYLDMPWDELGLHMAALRRSTDRAIVGPFWGHIFQACQVLRGWDTFMMDLIARPKLAQALMERLTEAHIKAFDLYAETVAPHLDVILVCDDLGMQEAMWMSPDMYRRQIKPYHAKLYGHIKKKTGKPLLLHSDGSFYPVIPDLIEIGVDAINPVQYTARNMDLVTLKREFGADMTFWGAGVDTQKTLSFGTPDQVADEVKRNLDILAPGGGFVFAAVHNIVEGVPPRNIIAAFKAAVEYGI